MIKTLGLTHLALTVSDLERSFQFYHDVFGMLAIYRDPAFIQAQTPGSRDAGGKLKHRGEFCPGEPYVFFADPDGYEVEVWYEIPTETGR